MSIDLAAATYYYFNDQIDSAAAVTEKLEDSNVAVGGGTFSIG